MDKYKYRCTDCPYLVEDEQGRWYCDCREKVIYDVPDEICPTENPVYYTYIEPENMEK